MPASPTFTGDPISESVVISAANTNRDGVTGTYATAYTFRAAAAGGKGGRIDFLTLTGQTATVAGVVLMFVNNSLAASLVREIPTTVVTPSTSAKGFQIPIAEGADINGRLALGIVCKAGDIVRFCTTLGQTIFARVEGGEF